MRGRQNGRGFALITVLCVVLIVSAVALTLASSMRVEVRQAGADRAGIQAEELCASAHEMAIYLVARGLGTPAENLDGLPVEVVQAGFHYVLRFPAGPVHLFLEGEDGKLNLSSAPRELLEGFFSAWIGDAAKGQNLAAVVVDWRDPDDTPEPGGAEQDVYLSRGYVPRNRALGAGDSLLLAGLQAEDFRERLLPLRGAGAFRRRSGLQEHITSSSVGLTVNPTFASEVVLAGIPGLGQTFVERIVAERQSAPFQNAADFAARVGIPGDSPVLTYLHFVRRAPAILAVANTMGTARSERRILANGMVIHQERNVFPFFANMPAPTRQ